MEYEIAGIIYCLYSCVFNNRKAKNPKDKRQIKSSVRLYYYDAETLKEENGFYYDSAGNKYALIDDWIYWDEEDRIYFLSGKIVSDRLVFE